MEKALDTTITFWTPPRRREFKPKQYDPGQRITWTQEIPGYWTGENWGDGEFIQPEDIVREGTIWSQGQYARQLWVIPDDDPANYILIELPSPRDIRWGRGIRQITYDVSWLRTTLRRVEHVRSCGTVHGVVQEERKFYSHIMCSQVTVRDLRFHTSPNCPDAQGKKPVWPSEAMTARDVIGVLMHEKGRGYSDDKKLCPRCVLLQDPEETSERNVS